MNPMRDSFFLSSSAARHVVPVSLILLLLCTVHVATELFVSLPCAPSNPKGPYGVVVVDVDAAPNQNATYTLLNCATNNDSSGLVVVITQRGGNNDSTSTMVTVHVENMANVSLEVANISSTWSGSLRLFITNITNTMSATYAVVIRNVSMSMFVLSAFDVWMSGSGSGIAIVQNSTLTGASSVVLWYCNSTFTAGAVGTTLLAPPVVLVQHSNFLDGSTLSIFDCVLWSSSAAAALLIADTEISGGSMLLMLGCSMFGAIDAVLVTNSSLLDASEVVLSGCLVSMGTAAVFSGAPAAGIRVTGTMIAQESVITVAKSHFAFENLNSVVAVLRMSGHSIVTGNSSVVIDGTCTYSLNVSTIVVLEGVNVSNKSILSFSGPSASSSSATMLWANGSCFVINGSSVFNDATVLITNWLFEKVVPHQVPVNDSVLYMEAIEMVQTRVIVSSSRNATTQSGNDNSSNIPITHDVAWWGPIVFVSRIRAMGSSLQLINQTWVNYDFTNVLGTVTVRDSIWAGVADDGDNHGISVNGVVVNHDAFTFLLLSNATFQHSATVHLSHAAIAFLTLHVNLVGIHAAVFVENSLFAGRSGLMISNTQLKSIQQCLVAIQTSTFINQSSLLLQDVELTLSPLGTVIPSVLQLESTTVSQKSTVTMVRAKCPSFFGFSFPQGVILARQSTVLVEASSVYNFLLSSTLVTEFSDITVRNTTMVGPYGFSMQKSVTVSDYSQVLLDNVLSTAALLQATTSAFVNHSSLVIRNVVTAMSDTSFMTGIAFRNVLLQGSSSAIVDSAYCSFLPSAPGWIPNTATVPVCVYLLNTNVTAVSILRFSGVSGEFRGPYENASVATITFLKVSMVQHSILDVENVSALCQAVVFSMFTADHSTIRIVGADGTRCAGGNSTTEQVVTVWFTVGMSFASTFLIEGVRSNNTTYGIVVDQFQLSFSTVQSVGHTILNPHLHAMAIQHSVIHACNASFASRSTLISQIYAAVYVLNVTFYGSVVTLVLNGSAVMAVQAPCIAVSASIMEYSTVTWAGNATTLTCGTMGMVDLGSHMIRSDVTFLDDGSTVTLVTSQSSDAIRCSNTVISNGTSLTMVARGSCYVNATAGSTVVKLQSVSIGSQSTLMMSSTPTEGIASRFDCGLVGCIQLMSCYVTDSMAFLFFSSGDIVSFSSGDPSVVSPPGISLIFSSAVNSQVEVWFPHLCLGCGDMIRALFLTVDNTVWIITGSINRAVNNSSRSGVPFYAFNVALGIFTQNSLVIFRKLTIDSPSRANGYGLCVLQSGVLENSVIIFESVDVAVSEDLGGSLGSSQGHSVKTIVDLGLFTVSPDSLIILSTVSARAVHRLLTLPSSVTTSNIELIDVHVTADCGIVHGVASVINNSEILISNSVLRFGDMCDDDSGVVLGIGLDGFSVLTNSVLSVKHTSLSFIVNGNANRTSYMFAAAVGAVNSSFVSTGSITLENCTLNVTIVPYGGGASSSSPPPLPSILAPVLQQQICIVLIHATVNVSSSSSASTASVLLLSILNSNLALSDNQPRLNNATTDAGTVVSACISLEPLLLTPYGNVTVDIEGSTLTMNLHRAQQQQGPSSASVLIFTPRRSLLSAVTNVTTTTARQQSTTVLVRNVSVVVVVVVGGVAPCVFYMPNTTSSCHNTGQSSFSSCHDLLSDISLILDGVLMNITVVNSDDNQGGGSGGGAIVIQSTSTNYPRLLTIDVISCVFQCTYDDSDRRYLTTPLQPPAFMQVRQLENHAMLTVRVQNSSMRLRAPTTSVVAAFLIHASVSSGEPMFTLDNATFSGYSSPFEVVQPVGAETMSKAPLHVNVYCSFWGTGQLSQDHLTLGVMKNVLWYTSMYPYSVAAPGLVCPDAIRLRPTTSYSITEASVTDHMSTSITAPLMSMTVGHANNRTVTTTSEKTSSVSDSRTGYPRRGTMVTSTRHAADEPLLLWMQSRSIHTQASGVSALLTLSTSVFGGVAAGDAVSLAALSMISCGGSPSWSSNTMPQRWIISVAYDAGPVASMFVNLALVVCTFATQRIIILVLTKRAALSKQAAATSKTVVVLDEVRRQFDARIRYPSLSHSVFQFFLPGIAFACGHSIGEVINGSSSNVVVIAVAVAVLVVGGAVFLIRRHFVNDVVPTVHSIHFDATAHVNSKSPVLLFLVSWLLPDVEWLPEASRKSDGSLFSCARDTSALWCLPWIQHYGVVFSLLSALPMSSSRGGCIVQYVLLCGCAALPMLLVVMQALQLFRRPLLNPLALAIQVAVIADLIASAFYFLGPAALQDSSALALSVFSVAVSVLTAVRGVYNVCVATIETRLRKGRKNTEWRTENVACDTVSPAAVGIIAAFERVTPEVRLHKSRTLHAARDRARDQLQPWRWLSPTTPYETTTPIEHVQRLVVLICSQQQERQCVSSLREQGDCSQDDDPPSALFLV